MIINLGNYGTEIYSLERLYKITLVYSLSTKNLTFHKS